MSRVTEAFRKSSSAGFISPAPPPNTAKQAEDRGSWLTTEVPWDFSESPAAAVAPAETGIARSPAIGEIRARSQGDSRGHCLEQLNPLVQRLLQSAEEEGRLRSVLFSAIGTDDGSAELCAAAGEALASQTTGSICLVDGNLRSPSVHTLFGVTGAPGLSDLLLQPGDLRPCLVRVRPNLWLLPAGSRCNEALPMLVAEQVRPLLAKLLATFDYVVLDTSAAGAHGDATALGPLVDGVVLMLEANATRREVARRTAEQLQAAHVRVLGAVLTNRTFPIPEAIYRKL
jgi:polysaccharide biosynthesis transport protein